MSDTIELYQFPISHYCEVVRWALDYKKMRWTRHSLIPGFHGNTVRRISKDKSTVPLLTDGENIIHGSREILQYLEENIAFNPLEPESKKGQKEADQWVQDYYNLGVKIRMFCWGSMLDHPEMLIEMMQVEQNRAKRLMLRMMYDKFTEQVREAMNINPETLKEAQMEIDEALSVLEAHIFERKYLVGNRFSKADLFVCSMLAPFVLPEGYGIEPPEEMPVEVNQFVINHPTAFNYVKRIYEENR